MERCTVTATVPLAWVFLLICPKIRYAKSKLPTSVPTGPTQALRRKNEIKGKFGNDRKNEMKVNLANVFQITTRPTKPKKTSIQDKKNQVTNTGFIEKE